MKRIKGYTLIRYGFKNDINQLPIYNDNRVAYPISGDYLEIMQGECYLERIYIRLDELIFFSLKPIPEK